MNWDDIKVFFAIADSGSLSGAAKKLGVNHSTVFRRLNVLEDDLGVRLFEKVQGRYMLSIAGEQIFQQGLPIVESMADIERNVMGLDLQPQGIIKVTAPHNISNRYLPRVLSRFNQDYPDVEVHLLSSNMDFNLNHRQADIAVRATASPPEHLVGRKIADIPWKFFASASYLEKSEPVEGLVDLKKHRLIGAAGEMLNLAAFQWLEKKHVAQIVVRADELTAMSSLAINGYGIALLPYDQYRQGLIEVMNFQMDKKSALWVLTHPDLRNVERIKLLMSYLYQYLRVEER